jgi:hypothetical protein
MALNSVSGAVHIYYAVLSSSGSDTVSVTFTSTTDYQNMYVYEVSGVLATPAGTASGYSPGGAPSAAISTSTSVTFQAGAFLLGVMATDGSAGIASVGPNFQFSSDKSGTVIIGQGAEWSTSGVSSPTDFPMSLSASTDWAEVGIALNPTAAVGATAAVGGQMLSIDPFMALMSWLILILTLAATVVGAFLIRRRMNHYRH